MYHSLSATLSTWWKESKRFIFFAGVMFLIVQLFCKPVLVNGLSMYPTLDNRDYLLVNRFAHIDREDIIVFRLLKSDRLLIKRVIGVEGDHVVIKNGKVFVNGKEKTWPVATFGDVDIVVQKDHYFVLGDNRPQSLDSRFSEVGQVSKKQVIGKVWVRVYPLTFY